MLPKTVLLIVATVALGACSQSRDRWNTEKQRAIEIGDCTEGQTYYAGECRQNCTHHSDCTTAGEKCFALGGGSNVCLPESQFACVITEDAGCVLFRPDNDCMGPISNGLFIEWQHLHGDPYCQRAHDVSHCPAFAVNRPACRARTQSTECVSLTSRLSQCSLQQYGTLTLAVAQEGLATPPATDEAADQACRNLLVNSNALTNGTWTGMLRPLATSIVNESTIYTASYTQAGRLVTGYYCLVDALGIWPCGVQAVH